MVDIEGVAPKVKNIFGYVLKDFISNYSRYGFKPIRKRWIVK